MRIVYVSLPTPDAVQAFVGQISPLDGQFDLLSDGYVLEAKSLMGIFGLDLTKPVQLRIEEDTDTTMQVLERFIINIPPAKAGRKKDQDAMPLRQ